MGFAGELGIPVPATIPTPEGDLVVERDGRFYSLSEHAVGEQVPRRELHEGHVAAMGTSLAAIHAALRAFPVDAAPRAHSRPTGHEVLDRIDAVAHPGPQEQWALERLRSRAAWLRQHAIPERVPTGDEQLVRE